MRSVVLSQRHWGVKAGSEQGKAGTDLYFRENPLAAEWDWVYLGHAVSPAPPSKEQGLNRHILNKCMKEGRYKNYWILMSLRIKARVFTGAFEAQWSGLLYNRPLHSVHTGLYGVLEAASLCARAFALAVLSVWKSLSPECMLQEGRLSYFSFVHLCTHSAYKTVAPCQHTVNICGFRE